MGTNPSFFRAGGEEETRVRDLDTSAFPVENVSSHDAVRFCERLSALPQEKAAGRVYRLPTEAEWEYACRAGTTTPFHFGNALTSDLANIVGNLPERAATRGDYLARTCAVGSYPGNAFGLYDMHGNVWEWCADWFDENYYPHSPETDPAGPPGGTRRSLRGGGWYYPAHICRSAFRYRYEPGARHKDFGFRVATGAG
jgi:formylglycine-generating enzyme required for sulfatase activity